MQITLPFAYEVTGTLKTRDTEHTVQVLAAEPLTANLKQASLDEAPVAVQITKPDGSPSSDLRWYDNQLWDVFGVRKVDRAPVIGNPEELAAVFQSNRAFQSNFRLAKRSRTYKPFDKNKYREIVGSDESQIRAFAGRELQKYMLIGDRLYKTIEEPTYVVVNEENVIGTRRHSSGARQIAIYVGFYISQLSRTSTYFRADQFDDALVLANRLAAEVGEPLPVVPSAMIRVLIPEAIRFERPSP